MQGATYIGLYTITKPNAVYVTILQYAKFPMKHMVKRRNTNCDIHKGYYSYYVKEVLCIIIQQFSQKEKQIRRCNASSFAHIRNWNCQIGSASSVVSCQRAVTSKSKSHYDRQSVGQSVLVSGTHLRLVTNFSFSRSGLSPAGLKIIFYFPNSWGSPNLEGQVPVFISPRNRVAQLYPRALG
jgi:hypothetical protein